jgi:DNA-binding GntR family transcriptional regulator
MADRPPAALTRTYQSKSDLVTDGLRELITDGQLPPGAPLRQRELAGRFAVSHTPVREAIRRLEAEGLVVVDVHKGATVATVDRAALEENAQILAALEVLAGRLALAKITATDLAAIDELGGQVAASQADPATKAELNRRFHFRVYQCAQSPTLLMLMRLLWRTFPGGPQGSRPHHESVRQHAELIAALRDGDAERMAAVIAEHALGSIRYLGPAAGRAARG